MTDFYKFAADNPWLTFFLAVVLVQGIAQVIIVAINRPLRHWNIRKHGYPPAHCDADGDFKAAK